MVVTDHKLLSFDGVPLFYRAVAPQGPVRAIVLVIHGMGEHGGRYLDFAKALSDAGIYCVLPDLRGFGRSLGRRGDVVSFDDFIKDIHVFFDHVSRTFSGKPLFILGHSMGGLLASLFVAAQKANSIKGLILSSPLIQVAIPVPVWKKALARIACIFFPIYTQKAMIPPSSLTHDLKILERDAKDSRIHFNITARFFVAMERALLKTSNAAKQIQCPVLMMQSGQDKIVSQKAAYQFFLDLTAKDKLAEIYPEMYHEIFNEVGREQLFNKVINWILTRLK